MTTNINKATGLDGPGFECRYGQETFLHNVKTGSETHPSPYSMGTGIISRGVKRPGFAVDYSSPYSAEVEYVWSYASAAPILLRGVDRQGFTSNPVALRLLIPH